MKDRELESRCQDIIDDPIYLNVTEDPPISEDFLFPSDEPHQKFLGMIFARALKDRATDIYFEADEQQFRVRYRVDNILYEMMPPSREIFEQVGNEIKSLFGLLRKIKTGKKAQKSEFVHTRLVTPDEVASIETPCNGRKIRLNLTRLPTACLENYHIEIFDWEMIPSLSDELIKHVRSCQSGLILLSSPQDNGKTTTAYQMLNSVNTPDRVTLGVEKKPSYAFHGITRLLVNPSQASYDQMLKAIRAYNPDTIFFDDLDDKKTAKEVLDYSKNGKLVIAALTAKDCLASLDCLVNLGIDRREVDASLRGIVSQRLLKKVHNECPGKGCKTCGGTGYSGRIAAYQTVIQPPEITDLIFGVNRDSKTPVLFPQIINNLVSEGIIDETEAEYHKRI